MKYKLFFRWVNSAVSNVKSYTILISVQTVFQACRILIGLFKFQTGPTSRLQGSKVITLKLFFSKKNHLRLQKESGNSQSCDAILLTWTVQHFRLPRNIHATRVVILTARGVDTVSKINLRTFAPRSSHVQIFLKLWLRVENDKIRLKTSKKIEGHRTGLEDKAYHRP